MANLTFYDAAWPPVNPPHTDGVCIYISGDTPHVWTLAEIHAQAARYRLPIFVRSNPPGPGAATDAAHAVAALKVIGAPHGTLVAWDMETAADAAYIRGVYEALKTAGYELIVYGTQSDVMGNDNPDGLYWGADWTGVPHLHSPDAITQYVSFSGYDESLAKSSLPFWDTRPAPPPPPPGTYGAPRNLHGAAGHTSVKLTWEAPGTAGLPAPAEYHVYVYAGTVTGKATQVGSYPRTVSALAFEGGGLERGKTYTAHVVATGPGGAHARPGTFAAARFTTG